MSDYGVTPKGVVIKRLDTIMEEIHSDLSEGWNVNTRLNPKSFLNVLVTSFADKIAELWELGAETYYAMYPSTAEGVNLDYAAQFGGSTREAAAKTFYPIHCECLDGTVIPAGSVIASTSNPVINFMAASSQMVSRSAFNKAKVRVLTVHPQAAYTVALDGAVFSYTSSETASEEEILAGLQSAIIDPEFSTAVRDKRLVVEAVNIQSSHALILTGNLTTETVTGIVSFASESYGEVALPNGAITQIVTNVPGFRNCVNLCGYISGRLRETDVEFRQSYAKKIFSMSSRMIDSIKSAILLNVQGARSAAGYENDTDKIDAEGRPPHSFEMVVDGGGDMEVAVQILEKKAGGIQTYGTVLVDVPGEEGENIPIRFSRPSYLTIWLKVVITMSKTEPLPPSYVELTKTAILDQMEQTEVGKTIVLQKFNSEIYSRVGGIDYIDIFAHYSENPADIPGEYAARIIPVSYRQRAITDKTKIEVVFSG